MDKAKTVVALFLELDSLKQWGPQAQTLKVLLTSSVQAYSFHYNCVKD